MGVRLLAMSCALAPLIDLSERVGYRSGTDDTDEQRLARDHGKLPKRGRCSS